MSAAIDVANLSDAKSCELLETAEGSRQRRAEADRAGADQRATTAALGLDPLDAQIRQVFFFDTPDLALDAEGVVARARRIQGKGGDSVVKLRPVVPNELPADLRLSKASASRWTRSGGFVCSGVAEGHAGRPTCAGRQGASCP